MSDNGLSVGLKLDSKVVKKSNENLLSRVVNGRRMARTVISLIQLLDISRTYCKESEESVSKLVNQFETSGRPVENQFRGLRSEWVNSEDVIHTGLHPRDHAERSPAEDLAAQMRSSAKLEELSAHSLQAESRKESPEVYALATPTQKPQKTHRQSASEMPSEDRLGLHPCPRQEGPTPDLPGKHLWK